MKLLMMSMILLYFLPVMCSGHRAYPRQRTSYLSREQFHRICLEIADLKKADEDLKKANEDLIKANEDLQNRIIALEDSSNAAVDGHWTGWLSWSGCYDVDGTGQKTRQRLCLDPRPSNGGTNCVGIDVEQMECELPAVDGHWTGWLTWSGCYDVDGTGQKTRQRLCLDPRPSNGGTDCVGIDTEQMECELPAVDGHWTGWLSWSGCYDVDGTGQKTRQRLCLDPRPSNGGTDCVGIDTEQMECGEVDGNWTGWLSWSGCYDVDGTGQKTRQRLCLDPRPSNGGTDCVGIDTEQMECEEFKSAFAVSGENPISPDPNPSGVIAWPSAAIKTNVGVNYDPVTGLYTAPYDGTYAFHVNLYKKPGPNDGVYCRIVMDSTTLLADVNIVLTAGRLVGSASTIVHLVQGDTVAVVCIDFNRVDAYSSWMGFLVMAD